MSQPLKIVLGILAILPAIATAVLLSSGLLPGAEEIEAQGARVFFEAWREHGGPVSMLTLLVTTLFIVIAWRSPHVPPRRRVMWALLLVLGGPVTLLAFWWLYCWEQSPPIPGWRD
ncbi:MAG: hypothetical protein DIU56_013865 [Pseudomonadota bacterium]|jgi:Predicted membrane-associated, metal-dependent hydrolase|nr:MAG: hypothetical protein DIU56_08065 [Pseudomonadota bacterium]